MSISFRLNGKLIKHNTVYHLAEVSDGLELAFETAMNNYYSLLFIDYDAPVGVYLHGLIVNAKNGEWNQMARFVPPSPPKDTMHHYAVILYKQFSFVSVLSYERPNFPLTEFVHNLSEQTRLDFYVTNAD